MEQQTMAQPRAEARGMSTFFLIWFGQLVSLLGSGLTGFALGVWVFQQTRSVTEFTLIAFFGMLPFVIFSPIAGALVDRWDRRWALIVSEAGASLTPLTLIALLALGRFEIWPIYLIVAVSSLFRSFQFPAFSAATTLLVPREQLGRASGLVQLAQGLAQLLSPVLAGVLIGAIGLRGVYVIDVVTFVFSLATLLIVRIPKPEITAEGRAGRGSLLHEASYGWHYILARRGLFALLLFFAASNFLMGIVVVLATPLILSFASPAALGTVLSVAGAGLLVGSIVMSVWGGPQRRVLGVLVSILASGLCIIVAGLRPSALLIGAAAFFFTFGLPITNGCSQAIWQRKVEPDVQGRVFSTRSMIAAASMPIAYLVSGPLADYVFNPLLVNGGTLAGSVGRIIGVGPTRGIGLLFIVLGILTIIAAIAGYLYPRLRFVDEELPDAVPAVPPVEAETGGPDIAGSQPQLERI